MRAQGLVDEQHAGVFGKERGVDWGVEVGGSGLGVPAGFEEGVAHHRGPLWCAVIAGPKQFGTSVFRYTGA
jgi:hypothetical protein